MKNRLYSLLAATAIAGSFTLAACAPWGNEFREVTAERIARPAFMVERKDSANGMEFQLWERMHNPGEPANIYIEGDGDTDPKWDSTPDNPVALHLASRDDAKNLAWIGRPCQFQEAPDDKQCDPKFWSTRRFSPEVLAAYNGIIDYMKKRYDITEINLIGYDGGANVAAALAAQRNDVASLRTVAGELNPDLVPEKVKTKADADNVRAVAIAPQLASLPQHHFIGAGDDVAPPAVYHSFRQAMGETDCVHYTIVPDADHAKGWVEKWPSLLNSSVSCASALPPQEETDMGLPRDYTPAPFPPIPEDIDHGQK